MRFLYIHYYFGTRGKLENHWQRTIRHWRKSKGNTCYHVGNWKFFKIFICSKLVSVVGFLSNAKIISAKKLFKQSKKGREKQEMGAKRAIQ